MAAVSTPPPLRQDVLAAATYKDVAASGTVNASPRKGLIRHGRAGSRAPRVNRPPLARDPAALKLAKAAAADRAAAKQAGTGARVAATVNAAPPQYQGTQNPGLFDPNSSPSDSTGDIGPNNYVEVVNSQIGVFDRNLFPTQVNQVNAQASLGQFVGYPNDCVFDPQVAWDQQAGRWLFAAVDQVPGATCAQASADYLDFGWSTTSDPTGAFCIYSLQTDIVVNNVVTSGFMDDYPKLGHDNNFITIGANVYNNFGNAGSTFQGAVIWAIQKPGAGVIPCPVVTATFFGEQPTAAKPNPTQLKNADSTQAFTPVPADTTDSSSTGYIVAAHDPGSTSAHKIMVWRLTASSGSPVLTQVGDVTVNSYQVPPAVPQPSTGATSCATAGNCLDSLDGRLTQAIAHFDPNAGAETVWTQDAVLDPTAGTLSVERWYELLPGSLNARQQGNISDPSFYIFNGAVSPTLAGNEAVIFYDAGSSASTGFVQYRAQRRNSGTALGTMTNEILLASSTVSDADFTCGATQTPTSTAATCRWGDYAAARPDPSNATAVWGAGMIVGNGGSATSSGWTTQLDRVTPGCAVATLYGPANAQVGDFVQLTATATGCTNPQFEFWLRDQRGIWSLVKKFSSDNFWTWDTVGYPVATMGSFYSIVVWANEAGDSLASWEAIGGVSPVPGITGVFLNPPDPCQSVNLSGPVVGAVGSVLNFTSTIGQYYCSTPVFEYWLKVNGAWVIKRPFSTDPNWAWKTAGLAPGTYPLVVWANQRSSPTGHAQAWAAITVSLNSTTCLAVTDTASPPSAAITGTSVALTATASGCPNPSPLYEFWVLAPGASLYTLGQAYGSSSTFNWNTAGLAPGSYRINVWARDASSPGTFGNPSGRYDAYNASLVYTVSAGCPAVGDSASPSGAAMAGMSVSVTASAPGCPSPLYEFWVLAPGASLYTLGQAYGTSATFSWNTANLTPGSYRINVWVHDASDSGVFGNSSGRYDAYNASLLYTVTAGCPAVGDSASPSGAAMAGMSVSVIASAPGCPSPLYEFWVLAPGASLYTLGQAYGTSSTFSWNTANLAPGSYRINVWVHDAGDSGVFGNSSGRYDAYNANLIYTLTAGCPAVSASASPPSSTSAGLLVTITASGSSCPSPLYEVWVLAPGASNFNLVQAYTSNGVIDWITMGLAPGTYRISVWVRDTSSTGVYGNANGKWDAYASLIYSLT
jgi:hypothetical protein